MLLPEVAGRVVGRLAFVVRLHRNNTPLLRLKLSKLPPPVGKKKHRRASRHRVAPLPLPFLAILASLLVRFHRTHDIARASHLATWQVIVSEV